MKESTFPFTKLNKRKKESFEHILFIKEFIFQYIYLIVTNSAYENGGYSKGLSLCED